MANMEDGVNNDPLAPARTREEWEAQGWAPHSEPLMVASRLETTLSIRFEPDEALLLRKAARWKGLTRTQFVRQATLEEAQRAIEELQQ